MSHKLTKRQVRSIKKTMEHKGNHEARKQSKAEQRIARAQLRQDRTPRRREWDDEEAAPAFEKIRRFKVEPTSSPPPMSAAASDAVPRASGTVIEVRAIDSLISCQGAVLRGILPPSMRLLDPATRSPLAVGDRVELEPIGSGEARITAIQPRTSALVREVFDPGRKSGAHTGQAMAANVDQVVVVCTPGEPPFRARLLDRYLVAASRDGLPAAICLNKIDLGVPPEVEASLTGYERLGVRVLRASAMTGDGIDAMRAAIAGKVSLLTGHSGVGKSSLLNALEPGLALKVGDVTQSTAGQGKGRHTTSSARLVPLSLPETFVVDSPGIRAFGIRGVPRHELASHFADLAPLAPDCAYRDCLHDGESGCAVAAAARDDRFLRERLDSYRRMLVELRQGRW